MAKAILLCGKICSGKTTYAKELIRERRAVNLSVDEIMLSMFGMYAGEMHDEYARRTREYLLEKSTELIGAGIDVILDWGFWTRDGRNEVKNFYTFRGIEWEMIHIDPSNEVWQERIAKRNREIENGRTDAYFIDENLAEKFASLFEAPSADEINRTVSQ